MERAVYEIIADIQAKKEQFRVVPPYATFLELKAEMPGIYEGTIYAMLDAEVSNGTIVHRKTINGYAYMVAEE